MHAFIVLLISVLHLSETLTPGIPISPCPKSFQYRFDGQEWFGLVAVRNIEYGEALHLHITLSMRGKPRTNYLGEIELLTRGKYAKGTPVLYKVKFPKQVLPPKLVQISTNGEVVCLGAPDQGVFVTQIQLEHTRKYTYLASSAGPEDASEHSRFDDIFFIPKQKPSASKDHSRFDDVFFIPKQELSDDSSDHGRFDVDDAFLVPKKMPSDSYTTPRRSTKDICGRVDGRIRYQVLHALEAAAQPNAAFTGGDNTESAGLTRSGASKLPIVTSDDWREESAEPTVTRGAWPWMAAIYVNNLTSLAYQCSGTLISARVVVSSAHCFHMFQKRYAANEVLVFLGRQNLKNWNEEGSLAAPCEDIYTHPDYNRQLSTYDADIAVLILKNEVKFNTFIRPACVWSGSTKPEYIEGEHGVVAGWGVGGGLGTATHSPAVPRVISAPIVSNAACFRSDEKFRSLSSNRTFCAGAVQRSSYSMRTTTTTTTAKTTAETKANPVGKLGPCPGDSGAGLLILKNDQWLLRGIVSATLPATTNATEESDKATVKLNAHCSGNRYVIYTDVAQFLDWILAFTL